MRGLAVFLLAGLLVGGVAVSAKAELSRTEVQAIVREFIEKNPDVLMESLARYSVTQRLKAATESIAAHTPTLGPADAPITIVEYSEFQCPFCHKVQDTLKDVRNRYQGRVRFAFKHLPLDFHPQGLPAAKAAQAAQRQGKFWEYSDILWERQQYLGEKLLVEAAKEVGLDMDKFNADRASDEVAAEIAQDLDDAALAGARGTPYFLINGQPLSGAQPLEAFIRTIEDSFSELEEMKRGG